MKVEAYRRLIEALHEAKHIADVYVNAEIEASRLSDEARKELYDKSRKAGHEIARAANLSGFLLSDEVRTRLGRYEKEQEDADSAQTIMETMEGRWSAATSCLEDLIKIARSDLKIDKSKVPRGQ